MIMESINDYVNLTEQHREKDTATRIGSPDHFHLQLVLRQEHRCG